jgi:putative ABC transport system permease protein
MTFFTLARKNIGRKPLRTALLMVCVAVAFLIYGLSASFLNGSQGAAAASERVLGVTHAAGISQSLPLAYLSRIAADPDVAAVTPIARLRGFVGQEKNVVAVSAVIPAQLAEVNGQELGLTPQLIEALGQLRDRVLVGRLLADAQGWAVGDRITFSAFDTTRQDGGRRWRFEVAGIFEGESANTDTYFMVARYDYINAARARGKDTVSAFALRPRPSAATGELAAHLDAMFANSAAPTRTQSEKQFLDAFLRQYADIGRVLSLVVGAAFITLLMIVINTMVFAVRERLFEIGVLKTLGFDGPRIVMLIMSEVMLVFAVGGGIGLTLAKLATFTTVPALGLVFSLIVLFKAVAILLALALVCGMLPAIHALRTPVISAFRTR